MTGREFENAVIELAKVLGYLVHHQRPMQRADGQWRSGISGDKGLPDLILAGRRRVIFIECKVGSGRTTKEQDEWIKRLHEAGTEAYVLRPADLPTLAGLLSPFGQ